MDEPIAITIAECARLLSVTRKHVYHLFKTDPDIPQPFKLGRCARVLRSEVIAYAANKARRPMKTSAADKARSPHRRPTAEPLTYDESNERIEARLQINN